MSVLHEEAKNCTSHLEQIFMFFDSPKFLFYLQIQSRLLFCVALYAALAYTTESGCVVLANN